MKKKVFISILTTLICIPLFMDTPFAEGNNIRPWAYGTYSSDFNSALDNLDVGFINIPFGDGVVPIPVAKTRAYQEINFQMTNYMDGYISMYFNNMPSTNLCDIYVSNATIQSWNYQTGYLSLAINGVDNFTVTLVNRSTVTSWLTSEVSITFGGISLNAVNAPAYSLHNMDLTLIDCNTTLSSILSAVDNLEGYTDNIETLLTDIKNYVDVLDTLNINVGTINTNVVNAYNKLTSIDNRIAIVNNTLSSILSAVDNLEGYTDNIETLINDVTTYQSILLQIMGSYVTNNTSLYEQMEDILINLDELINDTENIKNSLNSLLNSDKLPIYSGSFVDMLNVGNATWNSDIQGTYTIITGNSVTYDVYLLTGFKYVWFYAVDRDVSTIRPVFTSSNVSSSVTRTLRSHNLTYYMVETTVTSSNRYTFTWNATTNFCIYPLYFGTDWSMPSELMFIARNYYKDMYTYKLDEVINAINSMDLEVNNLTVNANGITYNTTNTQVTNSITEYNTNIDQIYNIENNFALDFETYEQNYNPSFTDINRFVLNGSNHMNQVVTKLYNLDFIKYPTILTLAGIVLLALLGV